MSTEKGTGAITGITNFLFLAFILPRVVYLCFILVLFPSSSLKTAFPNMEMGVDVPAISSSRDSKPIVLKTSVSGNFNLVLRVNVPLTLLSVPALEPLILILTPGSGSRVPCSSTVPLITTTSSCEKAICGRKKVKRRIRVV